MRLELEARDVPSRVMVWLSPVVAVLCTVAMGGALFAAFGLAPLDAMKEFFVTPVSNAYGVSELLVKATPLTLCAIGLSLGFRANVWNIGAEGQLTLGAIAGSGVALYFYESDSVLLLPAMVIAGVLGGMAWAAIPALLKTRFNANEILVSLMLVYVATLLLSYLVHGPWRDPDGFNFPESRLFHAAATMPLLVEGTRLHVGGAVALVVAALAWLLLARCLIGFQVKVVGQAPAAARYAGFDQKRLVWFCLLTGGALAGLAGLFEVAGPVGQLVPTISPGYGFTAIIVAFVGRLHPVGIVLAALLMAMSYLGGEAAQMNLGLPAAVTGVFQGMLLFFLLAADVLIHHRIRVRRAGGPAGQLAGAQARVGQA